MATESRVLSEKEVQMINTVCFYLSGTSGESWWNEPGKAIVFALRDLFVNNPMATDQEVMDLAGWDTDDLAFVNAELAPLNRSMPFMGAGAEVLPSPRSTNSIIPIFIAFTILSTIVIALRIWSRISIVGRIQSFDWMALFSYVFIVAWCALAVYEKVASGEFSSYCDRSYNQARLSQAAFHIGMALYPMAVLSVKLALLLFYYNVSNWQPMRIAVYATAGISIVNAIIGMCMWLFKCNYVDIWNHGVDPTFKCSPIDRLKLQLAVGSINIITDLVIWILPLPLVWKLQLYPRERILAVFTFGLGIFACIGSIVRLVMVREYLYYGNNSNTPIQAWAMVELNLALICSSAPALRALIIKHAPKLLSYAYSTGAYGSGGSSDFVSKGSKAEKSFVIAQTSERSLSRDESV